MKYIPTLKKTIPEGEPMPRFYGRSYRDWSDRKTIFAKVAYPIPINLIVAGVRSFLYWAEWRLRAPKPTWLEHRMAIVYDKGRDTRAEMSRAEGYTEGFENGRKMLFNEFWKEVIRQGERSHNPEVIKAVLVNTRFNGDYAELNLDNDNPPPD